MTVAATAISFFTDGTRAAKASPYQIKLMEREEVFSFLGL